MDFFFHILRRFQKLWYHFVFIPLLVGVSVLFLTANQKPVFTSEGTFYVNLPTNKGLSLTNEEFKQFQIATYFQNLIELVRSNQSAEFIRLNLLNDYLSGKTSSFSVSKSEFPWTDSVLVSLRVKELLLTEARLQPENEIDAKLMNFFEKVGFSHEAVLKSFSMSKKGNSDYIKVSADGSSPFEARQRALYALESMQLLHKNLNRDRVSADRLMFERLVESARLALEEKMAGLEQYKINNNIINLPEHTKAIVNQMVQLEVQRAQLVETLESKRSGLLELEKQLGSKPEMPFKTDANTELLRLRKQSEELKRKTSLSVADQALGRELSVKMDSMLKVFAVEVPVDLRATRQELLTKYLAYRVDIDMTGELIPLVDGEIRRVKQYAQTFAPFESNIATLEREIYTAQESYLLLLNKLNLARTVEQGSGGNELVVVDAPTVPFSARASKRKMLAVISVLAVVVLLAALIIAIEWFDTGIWSVARFESAANATVAAVIPDAADPALVKDTILRSSAHRIAVQQLKSLSWTLATKPGAPQIIGVTGAFSSDGQLHLAQRLQKRFQAEGLRTLLIDADWISAQSEDTVSLGNWNTNATDSEILTASCYAGEEGPFSLLDRNNMGNMLSSLLVEYDRILIVPPGYAETSDWLEWSEVCQTWVYLFTCGRTVTPVDLRLLEKARTEQWPIVLDRIPVERLEDFVGEIPKNRSFVRTWIKKLLTFSFSAKKLASV